MPLKLVFSDTQAEKLTKAMKNVVRKPDAMTDFERQNPAAKRLVQEWTSAYDICVRSIAEQVAKVLSEEPNSKET